MEGAGRIRAMKALAAAVCIPCILTAAARPAAAGDDRALSVLAPSSYLPGTPILVWVELRNAGGDLAREVWDAEAALSVTPVGTTLTPNRVTLWNGVGSALVTVGGTGDAAITASLGALQASKPLRSLAGEPMTTAAGNIAGPLTEWSGIVHVTGAVTVPVGVTLRILPGTLVLVDGVQTAEGQPGECQSVSATPARCGKSITVSGRIESRGTEDDPVTITAAVPAQAWGEIHYDGAAASAYEHTLITRAGNSPRGGHTSTGPAIRATDSTIRFDRCAIADTAGKSMQATGSNLEFHNTLLTRSTMGPEINGTALIFDRSYSLELHGSDDNDGIYLHSQRAGQVIALTGCVIASGDDDGIDTLGSRITVEDCIVRDFANPAEDSKGLSVFSGEVTVKKCLFAGNKVGISAKSQNGGGATVRMERTTVAASTLVGIQAEDKFGEPDLRIKYFVTSSIVRSPDAVRTDYAQFPDDIQIKYSDLSEPWPGANNVGNITQDPLFADEAAHDYRIEPNSPCIDAGEASLPPDPDGTRADMGAYPYTHTGTPSFVRGRVNEDAAVDISDAVTLLFYLFGGRAVACEDAADTNDDGTLDVTDAIFFLDFLFRDGPVMPGPEEACGVDPTTDTLGCSGGSCG